MDIETPTLDPAQVAAVAALQTARADGHIDLPGIGRAKILESRSVCLETFPPRRTTTLTIELEHEA